MSSLRKLCGLHQVVRRMSDLSVETHATRFAVVKGKFVKVPAKPLPTVSEEITHTGQYFEEKDWRRNRFHDRTKLVNQNWAVKMVAEIPPVEVEGRIAVCDGRDGPDGPAALGHPRVYMNLDKDGPQSCMYCGLRYVQKHHH